MSLSPRAFLHRPGSRLGVSLFVLLVLPCIWWYPLLGAQLPDFMDTVTQLYPMRLAAANQIRSGTLPLWMPNIFFGAPMLANPQIAVLYPPNLLFYIAPGSFANGVICILHYIGAGFGTFFLIHAWTRRTVPALFAGFTFQFCAMLVSRIALTPHLYTAAWVPWMFLAADAAARERGWLPGRHAVILAVLATCQVLAGSPQLTYYTALAVGVFWLARGTCESNDPRYMAILKTLLRGVLTGFLAFAMSAVQLLPSLEYLAHVERSAIPIDRLREQALNGGFLWRSLVGLTGPVIEDTDSINAIGPGAIALALYALARRRDRARTLPLLAIGVMGYLLSVGALIPLWAKLLPLAGSFHAPRRALILWSIVGPVLAGMGAYHLLLLWRAKRWPRWIYHFLLVFVSLGTVAMLPRLERVFTSTERFQAPHEVLEILGDDRFLVIDPTLAYSYDSRREDYGRSMLPDLACWHGTYDVNGYDPLVLKRTGLAREAGSRRSGVFYPSHGVFMTDPNAKVLELLNVRYLVGRYDLFEPSRVIPGARIDKEAIGEILEIAIPDERWPVFEYRDERPLAWAVRRVVSVPNARAALELALANDPRQVAFVEEEMPFSANEIPKLKPERLNGRTFRVEFEEPTTTETFVCVSSAWMPGWRAETKAGEFAPVLPVNGIIMGVLVPPGTESFVLRYAPRSFVRGGLLTLAGLILGAALVLRSRDSRYPTENTP